jgi:hypothetical protein
MAELPFDKPTQDISWADDGTRTEPSAGRKSTGFVELGARPSAEFNWRYYELALWIAWLYESLNPAIFTTATEAIDALDPGDQTRIQSHQRWDDGDITKVSAGVTHLCTDARRVYYVSGTNLSALTADATTERQSEWSTNLTDHGMTSVDHIATDGQILAAFGDSLVSGKILIIFTISDFDVRPEPDPEIVDEIVLTGSVIEIRCDSIATTQRVWIAEDAATNGSIRVWTPSAGLIGFHNVGSGLDAFGVCADFLALQDGTTLRFIDKVSKATTTSAVTGRDYSRLYGEANRVWGLDADDQKLIAQSVRTSLRLIGFGEIVPYSTLENRLVVGDRIACTNLATYSLDSGRLLHLFETPSDGDIALAGQHLWAIIGGALVARPVALQGGEIWDIKSNGSDVEVGRSDSALRLIMRQDQ